MAASSSQRSGGDSLEIRNARAVGATVVGVTSAPAGLIGWLIWGDGWPSAAIAGAVMIALMVLSVAGAASTEVGK